MKSAGSVFLAALLLIAATTAGAQAALTLRLSTTSPKVDGVVSADEYTVTSTSPGLQVNLAWTADGLFVAVTPGTATATRTGSCR